MAELEICVQNLLEVQRNIVSKVNKKIERIQRHHRDCNIANTVGVGTGVAATAGLILAPFTAGLSTIVTGVAVAGMAAGAATSIGTSIADIVMSKDFINEVNELVKTQEEAAEEFKTRLKNIQAVVMSYKDETKCPEDEAWVTVLSACYRSGKTLASKIMSAKGAMSAAKAAKFARDVVAMEKAGCTIGFSVLTHVPAGASAEAGAALGRVGAKIGTQAAEATGKAVTRAAGKVLLVAGSALDIGFLIYGWAKKHPTLEGIEEVRKKLQDSIKDLEEFLSTLNSCKETVEEK